MKRIALLASLALIASGCTAAHASGAGGPGEYVAQFAKGITPSSEFALYLALNGEPTKLGVLTSTGSSVTQATTATPFTIASADCATRIFLFKCDAGSANVGPGATCDTSVTGANHKVQLASAYEPFYMRLSPSTSICLDAPASTTINCAVFCMKND